MHVRLHIDFEVSPRVKRVLKFGVPIAILLAGSVVFASVPNTFKDGDSLAAQTMNDNFTALDTRIANLETLSAKETNDGGFAPNASYCGASASTTKGDMSGLSVTGSGYVKARTQCQLTCSSPSAHFCDAHEIIHSAEIGASLPTGWYASGLQHGIASVFNDCKGWTDGTNANVGAVWAVTSAAGNNCDATWPVLCCN